MVYEKTWDDATEAAAWVELCPSPGDEPCVPADPDGANLEEQRADCRRYIRLLRKKFGREPPGARLAIVVKEGDYSPYLLVLCLYEGDDHAAARYALACEKYTPETWHDDAPLSAEQWKKIDDWLRLWRDDGGEDNDDDEEDEDEDRDQDSEGEGLHPGVSEEGRR